MSSTKKRILITGKGSYIGTSFIKWLSQWPDKYEVDEISVRGEEWKKHSFSQYDAVLHVAGIAHVSADPKMEDLYYQVNRDLTIVVAKKAKNDGVKQFLFMSSIIVYGDSRNENGVIDKDTVPKPSNFYGNSKLQAEEGIRSLESEDSKIVIIRPPMVYGKGSKGNYARLASLAKKVPIFPDVDNQRSMLHIDNLCEFIRFVIKNEETGMFFPQNIEYVKTSEMVKQIAEVHGKRVRLTSLFNVLIKLLRDRMGILGKLFNNLTYAKSISKYQENYLVRGFKESIFLTEGNSLND